MVKIMKYMSVLFGLFLLTTIATTSYAAEIQNSGYLEQETYAKLAKVKLPSGRITHRWVSAKIIKERYPSMVVKDVVFYPKMEPNPQVNLETLKEVQDYLTQGLKNRMARTFEVVEQSGPGVMEMQVAVTGIAIETEGMKAYEILPIAAVFGALKAATGTRDKEIGIYMEAKVVDSESGELLAAAVRVFDGANVVDPKKMLALEDFRENLDEFLEDASQTVNETMK